MTGRRLRWGILSTANIGRTKVIPGIKASPSSQVVAIASRDRARAGEVASELGIERAYGSYEELIADGEVDAIYNPLPNHLHVDYTLAAARAGKHVLCEKPIALSVREAERLRECPANVTVAEAFMVRYHPQWLRVREIVRSGELGEARAVRAVFSYVNMDADDVRNKPEIGGGAILDIGCYPVTGGRFFFEAEPKRVVALIDRCPRFGTDRQASVIADFGEGRQLAFTVSTQLVGHQSIEIIGTRARAEIVVPFNAPQGEATAVLVDEGLSFDGHLARREVIAPCDQYAEQAEAFARSVLTGKPLPWGIDDAIASMRVLDAIFESERAGGWVTV
ncbi:MAG: deoxyfructose oxidoreductase [Alphaproteobacteria bacterium]|nr:MAG: deoxyfructose oxidoreductase [Alphaproteobacteria bacterium]